MKLFAVSMNSVYEVGVRESRPYVRKIAGSTEGTVSLGGYLPVDEKDIVLVTRGHPKGLKQLSDRLYNTSPAVLKEDLPTLFLYSTRTAAIVGLFLDREEALACFEAKDGQAYDDSWEHETFMAEEAVRQAASPLIGLLDLDENQG